MFQSIALMFALMFAPLPSPAQVRTAYPAERGLDGSDFPRVVSLGREVYAYEALREPGFTTVSLFVVGSSGVLIADGQEDEEATKALLEAIAGITVKPVRWMIIGSAHADHTGGNAALPAGTILIAHPDAIPDLAASGHRIEAGPASPGDILTIDMGDRSAEVHFLGRAHTASDLIVRVPDAGVLFLSEVFMNRVFPPMRSAYPREWEEALDRAARLEADHVVPGHGFVDGPERSREELAAFAAAVRGVRTEAERLYDVTRDPVLAAEIAEWGEYGTWMLADSQRLIALRRVFAEQEDARNLTRTRP